MGERFPVNASIFGPTGAGKAAMARYRHGDDDVRPWPPLVTPAPQLDPALLDGDTVDLSQRRPPRPPRHLYDAPVFVWQGPGGELPARRPAAEDLRYLPVLDGHTFLYGPHCVDQVAAAARQFGGPGHRCLQTTTTHAGDFQHTHVCVRQPHQLDEDHCSFTGYRWRTRQ